MEATVRSHSPFLGCDTVNGHRRSRVNSRDSGYVLQRVEQNLRNIGSGKYIFSEFQLSAKADRVKQA